MYMIECVRVPFVMYTHFGIITDLEKTYIILDIIILDIISFISKKRVVQASPNLCCEISFYYFK